MPKKDINPADEPYLDAILSGLIKRRLASNAKERRNSEIQIAEAGKQLSIKHRSGR